MKALVLRVDTAQSITQWYWRPLAEQQVQRNLSDQTSQPPEHVVVNYRPVDPEHLPRTNDHEGAQCRVVALEVPRGVPLES